MSDEAALGCKILELSRLGQFELKRWADGRWYARVSFPAPEGVTAAVATDMIGGKKHRDPVSALLEVEQRIANLKTVLLEGRAP